MSDPFHPETPHEIPEGWQQVIVGRVREHHKVWDIMLGWVHVPDSVGKPVGNFGTVIEPKPWGPTPEPGDKWSFGGREMVFVGVGYGFHDRNHVFIWLDPNSKLHWVTMSKAEFYESGIKTELVSKGHDVPRSSANKPPTA